VQGKGKDLEVLSEEDTSSSDEDIAMEKLLDSSGTTLSSDEEANSGCHKPLHSKDSEDFNKQNVEEMNA